MFEMNAQKIWSTRIGVALFALLVSGVVGTMPALAASPTRDGKAPMQSSVQAPNIPDIPAELGDDVSVVSGEGELPFTMGPPGPHANVPSRTAESGLHAFNTSQKNSWKAHFNNKTGKVKALFGALSKRYENGPEKTARSFLSESTELFGLQQNLSDLKTVRVDETPERDHVRFQQTHNGIPVVGAFVIVHANKNSQVTMVQNGHAGEILTVNSDLITAAVAGDIARNDLKASQKEGTVLKEGKSEKLVAPQDGAYSYVWQITIPTEKPFGLWVYRVDAESGKILYKANEIDSLKTGQGKAYTSNANWHKGTVGTVPLKSMFTSSEGYTPGYIWGLFANVFDYGGNDPWSPTYKFLYDPFSQPDWFNATQAYYAINTVHDWWQKTVIAKYGPTPGTPFYSSIPVITNVDMCNAFYSSDLIGTGPGIAFGGADYCAPGSANLVQDWDVVRHEYTHAMMDWNGFNSQFSSPSNYYGRAMGEGNADWFSFLPNTKDPFVGDVAWNWSSEGYLRDLDNTRMYPYDVDLPAYGLPEEHYTGEIWSNYLYDLTKNLGASALPYAYKSFFYFDPAGGFMPSYPDFYDAIWAQIVAEFELTGKYTNSLKAYGSMVSRGITGYLRSPYSSSNYFDSGFAGSDSNPSFWWNFPYFKSISTKANLLYTQDPHEYLIHTAGTMKLTVTVTGSTSGMTNPSIDVYDYLGNFYAHVSGVGTKGTLTYPALPDGWYVIKVTGTASSPARGYYGIRISMQ
jgi:Zn-dependent metalloprotease